MHLRACEQKHLPLVTVIISIGVDNPSSDRARNLKTALAALSRQSLSRDEYRVIVVEQGPKPLLESAAGLSNEYVFAYNASGAFNRSWGRNVGAMRATTGVLCTFDADMIVPRDFLQRGLLAWRCGALAIRPYSEVLYMDDESTAHVRQEVAAGVSVDCEGPTLRGGIHPWSKGGCLWVDAGLYHRMRGHDERFRGWGQEDNEFFSRLERQTAVLTLTGRVLHLYHSRHFEKSDEPRESRLLQRALQYGLLRPQSGEIGSINRYRSAANSSGFNQSMDAAPYRRLGWSLYRRGHLAEAELVLQEAFERDPGSVAILGDLADVLCARGHLDKAADASELALRLEPDVVAHCYRVGRVRWHRREWDLALAAFQRGLAIANRRGMLTKTTKEHGNDVTAGTLASHSLG
jgi:glycosyltransferase involved in cell wall biosynthesis